jgi:hypothetical protein
MLRDNLVAHIITLNLNEFHFLPNFIDGFATIQRWKRFHPELGPARSFQIVWKSPDFGGGNRTGSIKGSAASRKQRRLINR